MENQSIRSVLVVGATGRHGGTGRVVADQLRAAGLRVRALSRNDDERAAALRQAGCDVAIGDLCDRNAMSRALTGMDAAYFCFPVGAGIVEAMASFASAAREVKSIGRVVVMSMGAAQAQSPSELGRAHWLAEEVLAWSGVPYRALRIFALFYENLPLLHGRSIREENVIRNSFAQAAVPWMSGDDAATLAVTALLHPERLGPDPIVYPAGSELLDHQQIAAAFQEELGREISFQPISRLEWQAELEALAQVERGVNRAMARHISTLGAAFSAPGYRSALPPSAIETHTLIGREPIRLREFIQKNRACFLS